MRKMTLGENDEVPILIEAKNRDCKQKHTRAPDMRYIRKGRDTDMIDPSADAIGIGHCPHPLRY